MCNSDNGIASNSDVDLSSAAWSFVSFALVETVANFCTPSEDYDSCITIQNLGNSGRHIFWSLVGLEIMIFVDLNT